MSDGRESVQNETDERRPRTSTSETNILAIREMIEWEIVAHVEISYVSAQMLPKSVGKVAVSPLEEDQKATRLAVCETLLARH